MPSLLVVDVSPRFDTSISRKLTAVFADQWRAKHPDGKVTVRDLARNQPPYVDLPGLSGPSRRLNIKRLRALRQSQHPTT